MRQLNGKRLDSNQTIIRAILMEKYGHRLNAIFTLFASPKERRALGKAIPDPNRMFLVKTNALLRIAQENGGKDLVDPASGEVLISADWM